MELGPWDVVARSIYNEIFSGRDTKHYGVCIRRFRESLTVRNKIVAQCLL